MQPVRDCDRTALYRGDGVDQASNIDDEQPGAGNASVDEGTHSHMLTRIQRVASSFLRIGFPVYMLSSTAWLVAGSMMPGASLGDGERMCMARVDDAMRGERLLDCRERCQALFDYKMVEKTCLFGICAESSHSLLPSTCYADGKSAMANCITSCYFCSK